MMNRNKEIDVMEYSKNDTANGENVSGIAYSLEELINWEKILTVQRAIIMRRTV